MTQGKKFSIVTGEVSCDGEFFELVEFCLENSIEVLGQWVVILGERLGVPAHTAL